MIIFYKPKFNLSIVGVLLLIVSFSCSQNPTVETKVNVKSQISKVEVNQVDGEYDFYIDGQIFQVKGAGLDVNNGRDFKALKEAGANSFRTWRTVDADMVLDSAIKYDLKVAMGIEMMKELHDYDYTDDAKTAKQFENIKKQVDMYKDHPQLLCWVVGNELNLLFNEDGSLKAVNPKVYDALSDIVDYIHTVDPNHPVTTTFAGGAIGPHVKVVMERCPQLDFLSYQVYNDLINLSKQEQANKVDKPYLVTEFGPKGHWEMPTTSWGREIEENSTQKAEGLRERIKIGLQSDTTGRNMGGFAFVWGQKQERTPTWYGIFNKDGRPIAVLDELTLFWSGKYPKDRAPAIKTMTLDGKVSTESVTLEPGKIYKANIDAFDHEGEPLEYKWTIMEEVNQKSQGGEFELEPRDVTIEIVKQSGGEIEFRSPNTKGEYRLFAYVYDKAKVGNANIPFLVK
jgi:hypothetical protein